MTVRLPEQDPKVHQRACEKIREKAWATAVHMLDAVLVRAAAHTAAVVSSLPPFDQSASVLSLMLSSSSSSLALLWSRLPPLNISAREYSMDLACSSVRTLVELDSSAALYDKLEHSLRAYTAHVLQELAVACDGDLKEDLTFMRLAHVWGHYRLAIAELQEVWVFFDRWYVSRTHKVRSIEGLALAIMKDALLQHSWLLQRAQAGCIASLRLDLQREGDARREVLLFTNLCTAIEIYFLRVEPEILNVVSQFFKEKADYMWRSGVSAEVFFQEVSVFLQEGRQRVHACLNEDTLPRLEEVMQTSLLADHGIEILTRDFARLIEKRNYDCIRSAWIFLASGPYVRRGKQCGVLFRHYILSEGVAIVEQLASRPSYGGEGFAVIKAIIELICRGECAIQHCFAEDSMSFTVQLNDALAEVLQKHQTEFAQQMARYVDWLLRENKGGVLMASVGEDGGVGSRCKSDTHSPFTSPSAEPSASPFVVAASAACSLPSSLGDVFKYIWRIYTLFPSKDIFEAFYWRDFARRLLHSRGAPNFDTEESFIQGLRKTCGAETSRFEGMLNDIKASQGLNARYRTWVAGGCENASGSSSSPPPPRMQTNNEEEEDHPQQEQQQQQQREQAGEEGNLKKRRRKETNVEEETAAEVAGLVLLNNDKNAEVELHILTAAFWPKQASLTIHLPAPLFSLADRIQEFYRHCFADRRLVWQHQISSAVVKCFLGTTPRQLTGSLLQVAMLLALQDMLDGGDAASISSRAEETVTVAALCERLNVDASLPAVASAVLGMCHPKFCLLLRDSPNSDGGGGGGGTAATLTAADVSPTVALSTPTIQASDRLRFNPHFTVSTTLCRIPLYGAKHHNDGVAVDKKKGEDEQTAADVMKEHVHVMEAAIVRFAKERRRVTHEELVATVPTLVRFSVTPLTIKHVIERLVNRGFLERNGPAAYAYVS